LADRGDGLSFFTWKSLLLPHGDPNSQLPLEDVCQLGREKTLGVIKTSDSRGMMPNYRHMGFALGQDIQPHFWGFLWGCFGITGYWPHFYRPLRPVANGERA